MLCLLGAVHLQGRSRRRGALGIHGVWRAAVPRDRGLPMKGLLFAPQEILLALRCSGRVQVPGLRLLNPITPHPQLPHPCWKPEPFPDPIVPIGTTWLQAGKNLSVTLWVPKKIPPPNPLSHSLCRPLKSMDPNIEVLGNVCSCRLSRKSFLISHALMTNHFSTFFIFQIWLSNGSSYLYLSCFPF